MFNSQIKSSNTNAENLRFRSPNLDELMYLQHETKEDSSIPVKICQLLIFILPIFLLVYKASPAWFLLILIPIGVLILLKKFKKDTTPGNDVYVLYATVMDKFIERHGSANAYYVSVWVDETQQFCSRINFRGGKTGSYNALMPGEKVLIYKSGDRIAAKPVPLPLMQYAAPENNENIR